MKTIVKIAMETPYDETADLSYLGEYSQKPAQHYIDRQERGDMGRHELRYFNFGCGDLEYIEQDYARYEAYNRGDWCAIGVRAVAEVMINGVRQKIKSSGLWGIESDSGADYLQETYREQLEELRDMLDELGFTSAEIDAAVES